MRHLFVMNPHAGKFDRSQEMLEKSRHIMAGRRSEWSAVRTEGSGHATRLVQEAAQQGDPLRVYACGGDGTLNEVVNGAAGQAHVAVTHCPMGSGNDFLRIFRIVPEVFLFYFSVCPVQFTFKFSQVKESHRLL